MKIRYNGKNDNYTGNEYAFRADLFGVKCYAMRSLRINKKKIVTQRFTQFNHRPQNVNTNVLIPKAIPWALSPWVKI